MAEMLLRPSEVAKRLGVSPKTISRWCKTGRMRVVWTLGGHARIPEAEIERMERGEKL